MTTVISNFSTSLDGFIADLSDDVGPLFDWYSSGDVTLRPPGYPLEFHLSEASARHWQEIIDRSGAMVCGRRLFDHTRGWGGNPPVGAPTFVVSHRPPPEDWPPVPDAPFTFVTDGLEAAVAAARTAAEARATPGTDPVVSVAGANIAQQCLNAGLLDEVWIDLVPVFLGEGIRYLSGLTPADLELVRIIEGEGVTHLRYRVKGHRPA
jgi:dihydrofolate reductase